MKELWVYGIKNSENSLLNSIKAVTDNYIIMPSIVYGATEYRVKVTDNSEFLKLIDSINKITGVMYTPERFAGMGMALNGDGTPWAEIGYANKTEAPSDVTIPMRQTKTILEITTPTTFMNPSHFEFRAPGAAYNEVYFRIYENDVMKGNKTVTDIDNDYQEQNEWYVFRYKAPVGAVYHFALKYETVFTKYRFDVYNYSTVANAYVENIFCSLREL